MGFKPRNKLSEIVTRIDTCPHDFIRPLGDGFGECIECGDNTFPLTSDVPSEEITCPRCSGRGVIPLSEELQETLSALRALAVTKSHLTAPVLAMQLGITTSAANNRLNKLKAAGFAQPVRTIPLSAGGAVVVWKATA